MDDATLLRRTVRRCTAVIVATLGLAIATLAGSTTSPVGVVLVLGGLGYLGWSAVVAPVLAAEATDGESATDH